MELYGYHEASISGIMVGGYCIGDGGGIYRTEEQ